MIKIKLSIYFKNHLNKNIKLDDKLVDVEDFIIRIENKKIYNSFTFITNGVYYAPDIICDYYHTRIKIKYQIDDNHIKELFFTIDSIEYLQNNNIKVYCKTLSYKYTKEKQNRVIQATSIKNLIRQVFLYEPFDFVDDFVIDLTKLTDIPLLLDYTIDNKTIDEVISDISKITNFDYYFYNGVLYFEDKKVIKKDDIAVATFKDIEDIETFSTSTENSQIVNKIYINEKIKQNIISKPKIILDIKDSPQCCSPNEVKHYIDNDNNVYKIAPVNAFYLIYYNPLTKEPSTNLNTKKGERIVVETYKLENDNFVELTGGILEILGVEGIDNYEYKKKYNILTFDFIASGELKITYKTNVLYGNIAHSEYPKNVKINIKHFNQFIEFTHKIELNGYYPIPYNFKLNLISDWGIDSNDAINKEITISKKEDNIFKQIGVFKSDIFAELHFTITDYGTYRFDTNEYESLYLDWYINNKELKMDETK